MQIIFRIWSCWVSGWWVGGSVVSGSVVGGFNKTRFNPIQLGGGRAGQKDP